MPLALGRGFKFAAMNLKRDTKEVETSFSEFKNKGGTSDMVTKPGGYTTVR